MSVHQKPDGRWYASYRDSSGKQRTRTFGRGSGAKKLAQAFDFEIKAKKKLGRQVGATASTNFVALTAEYVKNCQANGGSKKYIKELVNLIRNHIAPILPNKPVDHLTYKDVMRVAEYYKDRSQSTRNRYLSYMNAIFNFGIKHGLTHNNPLATWKKAKEVPRQTLLTVHDLQKIYKHAAPHLKWAIEVQWNLGTRPGPSELFSIRWDQVDFEAGVVRVYGRKTKTWREVPIRATFRQRLLEMKRVASTPYLIEYNGKPIKQLRRSFKTACKKAGIKYPVRMYDLRHLFASVMLAGGADLAAVSKILGHSSTKMTSDVYYHLLHGEKQRAVNLLPDLPNEKDDNKKIIRLVVDNKTG